MTDAGRDDALVEEAARQMREKDSSLMLAAALEYARAALAVVREAEPDHCYDPNEWDCTYGWTDRDLIVDGARPLNEPYKVQTLYRGPTWWAIEVPLTFHEGEPDDTEIQWFRSAEEAAAAASYRPAPPEDAGS